MTRTNRNPPGGLVYHVLNRGNDGQRLFFSDEDYMAFLAVVVEALMICSMRIIDYCVMPNHWHFIMWPEHDGELAAFMHWMTTTHASRWNGFRNKTGAGHVYQGPYKYFPIADDAYYFTACRYVARNAKRANLVERAEQWSWCSLAPFQPFDLHDGPIPKPADWLERVNRGCTEAELSALRKSSHKGTPYGPADWTREVARALHLEHTLRGPGRPKASR